MLKKASRPERIFLGLAFSVALSLCSAIIMAVTGAETDRWVVILLSLALGLVTSLQIRTHSLFKGPAFPMFSVFMLLQACGEPTLSGTLLAAYAFICCFVIFFFFMEPQFTRVFYLLFLINGCIAVYSPQWILWAPVMLALMISLRCFSARGLVASLLGLLTPYVLIPIWTTAITRSLEPVIALANNYLNPLFVFPIEPTHAYIFSAGLCVLLILATFLTVYGYPAKARARNMSIFVISAGAIVFPLFTAEGFEFWLPLLNLTTAYYAAHLISAFKRAGWVIALILWLTVISFLIMQLCAL